MIITAIYRNFMKESYPAGDIDVALKIIEVLLDNPNVITVIIDKKLNEKDVSTAMR